MLTIFGCSDETDSRKAAEDAEVLAKEREDERQAEKERQEGAKAAKEVGTTADGDPNTAAAAAASFPSSDGAAWGLFFPPMPVSNIGTINVHPGDTASAPSNVGLFPPLINLTMEGERQPPASAPAPEITDLQQLPLPGDATPAAVGVGVWGALFPPFGPQPTAPAEATPLPAPPAAVPTPLLAQVQALTQTERDRLAAADSDLAALRLQYDAAVAGRDQAQREAADLKVPEPYENTLEPHQFHPYLCSPHQPPPLHPGPDRSFAADTAEQ